MQRRSFLEAGAAAVALFPSSRALGANDRVRIALIGAGGRGRSVAQFANRNPAAEIVAVSDVYEPRMDQALEQWGTAAKKVGDYRRVLDDSSIDAVIIATPDHWHVPLTLAAVDAGKDVYCEKPVTQRLDEGERLIAGVEASDRVVATGTQQRAWDHFQAAKQAIDEGYLGEVNFVECYWYQDYLSSHTRPAVDVSKLDWKTWLGDRGPREFDPMVWRRWRFFWDFGGGIFTDLLTHWIDVIQWYFDTPEPEFVQAYGHTHRTDWLETPETVTATMRFPKNYTVLYHSSMVGRLDGGGIVFRGDQAMMKLTRDGFEVYPEGVVPPEGTRMPDPLIQYRATSPGTDQNVDNWLDCIRSRKTPHANVRAGVAAARTSHLCNQAMREGRSIQS